MTLNEYQQKAMTTCMPTCNNFSYMFLNLVGEVGEFASKIAKHIRKGNVSIEHNVLPCPYPDINNGDIEEVMQEAGDIAWQLAGLCSAMGWELEEICQMNLAKLASRKERGVIDGNGDNR